MSTRQQFSPHITVRVAAQNVFFGPGIVQLLQCIDSTHSVREGAKLMGISYSKAWRILANAERETGMELLKKTHGGKDGGGAKLTPYCEWLLESYRRFEAELQAQADVIFADIFRQE